MVQAENLRTVFMGTPEFALQTLEGLLASGVNLVGVILSPTVLRGEVKNSRHLR